VGSRDKRRPVEQVAACSSSFEASTDILLSTSFDAIGESDQISQHPHTSAFVRPPKHQPMLDCPPGVHWRPGSVFEDRRRRDDGWTDVEVVVDFVENLTFIKVGRRPRQYLLVRSEELFRESCKMRKVESQYL
jgi:hypothetical protein